MARSVKQTAKAPLGTHQATPGARTVRTATTTPEPRGTAVGPASSTSVSASPIYEELVAELGDPTA